MEVRVRGKATAPPKKVGDPTLDFQVIGVRGRPEPPPRMSGNASAVPNVAGGFSRKNRPQSRGNAVRKCNARRILPRFDTILPPFVRRPATRSTLQ